MFSAPASRLRAALTGVIEEALLEDAESVQLARSAGYTHYCLFTKRQREETKL